MKRIVLVGLLSCALIGQLQANDGKVIMPLQEGAFGAALGGVASFNWAVLGAIIGLKAEDFIGSRLHTKQKNHKEAYMFAGAAFTTAFLTYGNIFELEGIAKHAALTVGALVSGCLGCGAIAGLLKTSSA